MGVLMGQARRYSKNKRLHSSGFWNDVAFPILLAAGVFVLVCAVVWIKVAAPPLSNGLPAPSIWYGIVGGLLGVLMITVWVLIKKRR